MVRPPTADHLRAVPPLPVETVEREVGESECPEGQSPADLDAALDRALVVRAIAGDGPAWGRLYQRHFQRLYRDLLYMVDDPGTAEELVQETFAAALVSLRRFDHRSKLSTWLRGIAQNLVRKHWRGRARRGRAYDRLEVSTPMVGTRGEDDPERSHLQQQQAQVLSAVIETLPMPLREVFVMRDVQGLSPDDVAERLQITPGNVRVRANRARARIRQELVSLGWLEEGDA